jgi:hypothetical protein
MLKQRLWVALRRATHYECDLCGARIPDQQMPTIQLETPKEGGMHEVHVCDICIPVFGARLVDPFGIVDLPTKAQA